MRATETVVQQGGRTLAAIVREALGVAWSKAEALCETGRVWVDGQVELAAARRIPEGARVRVDPTAPRRRAGVLPATAIVLVDRDVVVVRKPAGVLTVPWAKEKDTLVDQARAALRRRDRGVGYDPPLGVVQRLDRDTSGLLVFARTLPAKKHLAQQLREHSVERAYLALVNGRAHDATHDTLLVQNRGDGLRGSWGVFRRPRGKPPRDARRAVTHVEVIERLEEATLLRCRLETGRQHQIRIHLSEAGTPLVGEPVYIRDHDGPRISAPRPMLHAAVLGFIHPRTGESLRFEEPVPDDFAEILAGLGGEGGRRRSPTRPRRR